MLSAEVNLGGPTLLLQLDFLTGFIIHVKNNAHSESSEYNGTHIYIDKPTDKDHYIHTRTHSKSDNVFAIFLTQLQPPVDREVPPVKIKVMPFPSNSQLLVESLSQSCIDTDAAVSMQPLCTQTCTVPHRQECAFMRSSVVLQ